MSLPILTCFDLAMMQQSNSVSYRGLAACKRDPPRTAEASAHRSPVKTHEARFCISMHRFHTCRKHAFSWTQSCQCTQPLCKEDINQTDASIQDQQLKAELLLLVRLQKGVGVTSFHPLLSHRGLLSVCSCAKMIKSRAVIVLLGMFNSYPTLGPGDFFSFQNLSASKTFSGPLSSLLLKSPNEDDRLPQSLQKLTPVGMKGWVLF